MEASNHIETRADAFDQRSAADELLEEWVAREAVMFLPSSTSHTQLPSGTRENSLALMVGLARSMGMLHGCCLQFANLFDLYCLHALQGTQFPSLATCIALVRLVQKGETENVPGLDADTGPIVQIAARLHPSVQTSEEEVNRQEVAVLQALGWRVILPSIQSWLEKFVIRLNVLTNDVFAASLTWLLEKSLFPATVLVMTSPTTLALPPQRQARGLLGLGLASAGLIPHHELQPLQVCHDWWKELFIRSGVMGLLCSSCSVPRCELGHEHYQRLLEMLEVACASTLAEVCEDCRDVALGLGDAFARGLNVRTWQEDEIQIAVSNMAGSEAQISLKPSQTLANVRELVKEALSIPSGNEVALVLNNRKLPSVGVASNEISNDSQLTVVKRGLNPKRFTIKCRVRVDGFNQNSLFILRSETGALQLHGLGPCYGPRKGNIAFYVNTASGEGPHYGRGIRGEDGCLISAQKITPGEWHDVIAEKGERFLSLTVDGQEVREEVERSVSQFNVRESGVVLPAGLFNLPAQRATEVAVKDYEVF